MASTWSAGTHNFNPLSPCGERLVSPVIFFIFAVTISIHSPHAGRDMANPAAIKPPINFNPLSPCGERLYAWEQFKEAAKISIHSPHAGRDYLICAYCTRRNISIHSPHAGRDTLNSPTKDISQWDFNPLSPCGERLMSVADVYMRMRFQSTLPMRGETTAI